MPVSPTRTTRNPSFEMFLHCFYHLCILGFCQVIWTVLGGPRGPPGPIKRGEKPRERESSLFIHLHSHHGRALPSPHLRSRSRSPSTPPHHPSKRMRRRRHPHLHCAHYSSSSSPSVSLSLFPCYSSRICNIDNYDFNGVFFVFIYVWLIYSVLGQGMI
jgi:hypothetical protein